MNLTFTTIVPILRFRAKKPPTFKLLGNPFLTARTISPICTNHIVSSTRKIHKYFTFLFNTFPLFLQSFSLYIIWYHRGQGQRSPTLHKTTHTVIVFGVSYIYIWVWTWQTCKRYLKYNRAYFSDTLLRVKIKENNVAVRIKDFSVV